MEFRSPGCLGTSTPRWAQKRKRDGFAYHLVFLIVKEESTFPVDSYNRVVFSFGGTM